MSMCTNQRKPIKHRTNRQPHTLQQEVLHMSKPKKEYRVTVSYCEKTPEEAERLRRHITNVLYDKKMLSLQRQKEKEAMAAQKA